jgi:endonuclease YncB( thermonuclease family)
MRSRGAGSVKWLQKGLSRVLGNLHARFLEERIVVIQFAYSANLLRKSGIIGVLLIIFLIMQFYVTNNEKHERKFISSNIRVVDGDTIVLNNLRIRLQGIDAPELKQECTNLISHHTYKCGEVAKNYLIKLIGTAKVACTDEGLDKYKRRLSYCYIDQLNLNREMVKSGNALAYTKFRRDGTKLAFGIVYSIIQKIGEKRKNH